MHNVIIIGTGGIGKRHIRGYLATGRARLSFVEPHAERRQEAEELYAPEFAYADLADADLGAFDLAVICTPAHLHLQVMSACIDAGTPFLVEKPLAVQADGAGDLIAAAAQKGVVARVGYVRRVAPELLAARERILSGDIGELKLVYVNSSQEFPKYRPDYRETYYSRPEMGGGAILDAASHPLDMLIWLLGRPKYVTAMYDRMVLEGSQTEDTCLISIRFENGAMANLTINQFQKRNVASTEFVGTRGNLLLQHSVLKHADDDSGTFKSSTDYMDGQVPMEAHEARFGLQAGAMMDVIEGKPDNLATLDDAYLNLQIALAAKQSWQEKRIIEIGTEG